MIVFDPFSDNRTVLYCKAEVNKMGFDRVAFTLFGKPIYWYGIIIGSALLLGVWTAMLREKRAKLPKDTAIDLALVCAPVAIVFARLYYVAFEWRSFASNPLSVFDIRSGGLAIYGALIGGALALVLVSRRKKIRYAALLDLVAPSLALGQGIGRWGNFCNQEAFGVLVTNERFQFFPACVYIDRLQEWHMATFFYESAWCLALWLLLEILVRKGAFDKRRPGDVFAWYVLLYSAERAVVEGLRTDSLYAGRVRISQALSLLAMLVIVAWFFLRAARAQKRPVVPLVCALVSVGLSLCGALGLFAMSALTMIPCNLVGIASCAALYRSVPYVESTVSHT